ncbi:MAG TPA: hypothetical protein VHZ95_10505, partial [Polyangiales bacterium]|nr:hypothetical protein [Polyangiales bacterium]
YDFASDAMVYSVAEYYRRVQPRLDELPAEFDQELAYIFRLRAGSRGQRLSAHAFLSQHRRGLIQRIAYWTGLYDVTVRALIVHLIDRSQRLDLGLSTEDSDRVLIDFTAFASALCMNRLYKGHFASNSGSRE